MVTKKIKRKEEKKKKTGIAGIYGQVIEVRSRGNSLYPSICPNFSSSFPQFNACYVPALF